MPLFPRFLSETEEIWRTALKRGTIKAATGKCERANIVSASKAKKALKYTLLPGIVPRMRDLFGSGFGYLAFLMAQIYGLVRLLPANHPYLNPQNVGAFGLRHVVAEAANHLVIGRKNIDQIIIFGALLAGLVIFALQFIFLIYTMFLAPALAFAQIPNSGLGIFATTAPTHDIAFIMLDRVFGIPNFFNSCVADATKLCSTDTVELAFPWPIHNALHGLFSFYSYGLLMIGMFIFLYFILVVVAETATTGTPFGQRFQNIWVPVRLVMAIGLLVPINHGLNSSQYVVLYAAKMGSSFATNGWLTYNYAMNARAKAYSLGLTASPTDPNANSEVMVGYPSTPDLSSVYEALSVIHTCAYTEWMNSNQNSYADKANAHMDTNFRIKPYFVKNGIFGENKEQRMVMEAGTDLKKALEFFNNGNIRIVFGEQKDDFAATGNVDPICGEIRVPVTSAPSFGQGGTLTGPDKVLEIYYNMVKDLWFGTQTTATGTPPSTATNQNALFMFAAHYAGKYNETDSAKKEDIVCSVGCGTDDGFPSCTDTNPQGQKLCMTTEPNDDWSANQLDTRRKEIIGAMEKNYNEYLKSLTNTEQEAEVLKHGWGGAGMWYNHIAEMNGAYVVATQSIPELRKFPKIMEEVRKTKSRIDEASSPGELFNPVFKTPPKDFTDVKERQAKTLYNVYKYWDPSNTDDRLSGNVFEDTISLIFGLDALFKMRHENAQLHPLAQLSLVGKGMVESTIRNVLISSGIGLSSGILQLFTGDLGKVGAEALGGLLFSTAFIGLTAGLVLYYVVPFLPFLYFFFAVANWVKGIFEAMVGAPLWALAHIRIDGEGLPGDAASNGYYLILDIILRPIVIVFGLIAAILIFGAQVKLLNIIWDLVVRNVTGFDAHETSVNIVGDLALKRDSLDQFFFTVIYAIIVYMLANACFKLIDMIPKDLMRWMGSGVTSFGDMAEGPAKNLSQYVAMGGLVQGQQLAGAVNDASKGLGGQLGNLFNTRKTGQ